MLTEIDSRPRRLRRRPRLVFSPLAWLKLQFYCHAAEKEIAGFGISAKDDPLYVETFVTVKQRGTSMTVSLDDDAVADYVDQCVDAGIDLQRCLRIWCHTHPGSSPDPSCLDEDTFARVFGSCDWAVMFILSRTSATYARLSFNVGPGGATELPVAVDWADWPRWLTAADTVPQKVIDDWKAEFLANICPPPPDPAPQLSATEPLPATGSPWEPFAPVWEWDALERELLEEYERHVRINGPDR